MMCREIKSDVAAATYCYHSVQAPWEVHVEREVEREYSGSPDQPKFCGV